MEIAILIVALLAGLAAGYYIGKLATAKAAGEEKSQLSAKVQMLAVDVEHQKTLAAQALESQKIAAAQALESQKESAAQALESQKEKAAQILESQKTAAAQATEQLRRQHADEVALLKEQMENERQHAASLRRESDQQWQERLEALKQEMKKESAEQLAQRQSALQQSNRTQMDELLKPIKEQFADFKKSVEESKTQNEVNKNDLQKSFESTMKLFQQEQQLAVTALKEQTQRIGSDAANLTRALKGDSKMQGDWGEMVLETILENSGLRRDEEYFIQENTRDENGNNFRPDVIVRFPEGRSVVIDSKVSLTAYSDAVAAEDDETRDRLLKAHTLSVRKHIDELAAKDYSTLVSDAIGFVLMFVPNETSLLAAMKQMPDISQYAYGKKIILVSPNTLMMALQLAYNLWQYDRQSKNVENIFTSATALYEKVAGYVDNFTAIGTAIGSLQNKYDTAYKQLSTGPGNILRRLEQLKDFGITPKKKIKQIEE